MRDKLCEVEYAVSLSNVYNSCNYSSKSVYNQQTKLVINTNALTGTFFLIHPDLVPSEIPRKKMVAEWPRHNLGCSIFNYRSGGTTKYFLFTEIRNITSSSVKI